MTTKFIEAAQTQNATDFQTNLETSMSEKVAAALETRKVEVASKLFGEETLGEVSTGLLARYIPAAAGDAVRTVYDAGEQMGKAIGSKKKEVGPSFSQKIKKSVRRQQGIMGATNKLTGNAKVPATK